MWKSHLCAYLLALIVRASSEFIKCCPHGYAVGDNLRCVMSIPGDTDTIIDEPLLGNTTEVAHNCYRSGEGGTSLISEIDYENSQNNTLLEICRDVDHRNGTIYTMACPGDWRQKLGQCDSLFKPLFFWGASIVVFASLVYILPYLIVTSFFIFVPDLRNRAYDKAVLAYNVCQLVTALILLGMGYFVLCHKPIKPVWIYIMLGLSLQFLTTASVFWLNVICYDMTLVITRFRWLPGSDVNGSEENRKFWMYASYALGGGIIVTSITCFIELCPWIPISSPIKPNFERFDDGANFGVIFHVSAVPVATLVLNNILFVYTTYKVIMIRKSTAVANENNKNVKRKYFVFLRLYLLMDAPWIVGVLAAVYSDLWILKFCRMLQPILMLLAILPKKKFYRAVKCSRTTATVIGSRMKNNKSNETHC